MQWFWGNFIFHIVIDLNEERITHAREEDGGEDEGSHAQFTYKMERKLLKMKGKYKKKCKQLKEKNKILHELYLGLEKRMKLLEFIRVSIDEEHESIGSEKTFPVELREGENIREEEQRMGEGEGALEVENVSIVSTREGSNNMG